LNKILYFSLGIKEVQEDFNQTKRFYPSAGARYPIESYVIANNVNELEKGLYHYNIKNNELEMLLKNDLHINSSEIFGDEINKNNPNFIILTSVMSRTEVKYGVNAYRFSLLECGHIGQNIYLFSQKEKLGCCAIGGFDNNKLVNLLDLSNNEIPLYCFSLGCYK
jgi:SagB-type dehydrogenase family enzyme